MNRRGFALIEVRVAGLVGAVLGGMFIVFLRMYNNEFRDGTASAKTQLQSALVSDEMARSIRAAGLVLAPDEGWTAGPALPVRDTTWIVLYDNTGKVKGAYKIDGGVLKESSDNIVFSPFLTGSDTVRMAQGSGFRLSATRKAVTLNLRVFMRYKNQDYETQPSGDMYSCRN